MIPTPSSENLSSAWPSRQQAEAYLSQGAELNPGPWVGHSRLVARAAEIIAHHWPGVDSELAYIGGLLHDIGRRQGYYGMRHVVDGYRFLLGEGYPAAARLCLTHSYPDPRFVWGAAGWDGSAEDQALLLDYLRKVEQDPAEAYTPYDRLIQLCDAISLPEGYCLMEKRLVDVLLRYGAQSDAPVKRTVWRWQAYFALKYEVEARIGAVVYDLLPGVVETTFAGDGEHSNRRDHPVLLLVTGLPCAGKSRLALHLAERFGLPLLAKDDIKERLFETLGWSDRQWSRKLGRATYALLYDAIERLLAAGVSLLAEANFPPQMAGERLSQIAEKHPFRVAQVECVARAEILNARWQRRAEQHERHAGHCDQEASAEFIQLIKDRTQPDGFARLGAVDVAGERLELDTSQPEEIDYAGLERWLVYALGDRWLEIKEYRRKAGND